MPALLGCVWQNPTTEQAIASAPAEIGDFLRFLRRHGEEVRLDEEVRVTVATHDTRGGFLGTTHWETDLEPVSKPEAERLTDRFAWIRDDTISLAQELSPEQMEAKPDRGRPIGRILSHILGAEYSYVSGVPRLKIDGHHALYAATDKGKRDSLGALREVSPKLVERLRSLTEDDLAISRQRSTGPWTARRMFRGLLEHSWEHYREIERRLSHSAD